MGEGDNEGSWSWAGEGSCLSGNTDFFWRTRKDTPCFTCRTICQPLLAARCVLRRLFDPSKLENSSRINKMCVISKCTEVYEESRTSVKQSSGGSKISERGGNPKGAHQPIIWPNFSRKLHENKKKWDVRDAYPLGSANAMVFNGN